MNAMVSNATSACRESQFRASEDGGMTILGVFFFIATCMIGAIALDVTSLYSARTQLQVAADLAAHAALYNRERMTEPQAKLAALNAVEVGMPQSVYGEALTEENIVFGYYDFDEQEFVESATEHSAVMVQTGRIAAEGNPVKSFLFRMIGVEDWDVETAAVYATYRPLCFREGFVSNGVVDLQSNNGFTSGFCVHSNAYVSLNQNNFFEPGTVVSMPDPNNIDLPQSGFEKNEGLEAALRSGAYRLRVITQLPQIIEGVRTYGNQWMPDYITGAATVYQSNVRTLNPSDLTPNRIHVIGCRGNKLTLGAGLFDNVVIYTSCPIDLSNGTVLENAVLATTSTINNSVTGSNGMVIGRNDNCAAGGGAQILTLGGVNFASGLEMYSGQIIASKDIEFAANADGIMGASMIAGGEISGTSNMEMGFCGSGNEDNFEVDYFRLVQ